MALQPLVGGDLGRVIHRPIGYDDAGVREIEWGERQEDDDGGERMEEDAELEEGEAVERETSGYDNLAYIDDKVDALLGQYKKDFEGSLYADKLGSKYGGYGSFLPTHVRDPVHAGTPRAPATRVPARSRAVEGALERARRMPGTANASGPASERSFDGTGPKANSQINGVSHPPDGLAANASAAGKTNKKNNCGPGNQKKGRPLTLRLSSQGEGLGKVQKKAMYNGFGLDHSSSPSDEDPDDETSASEDEGSPDRSPLTMIRRMTLHELPPGGLLSPLLDLLSEPLDRTTAKQASETNLRKKVGGPGASLPKSELGLTSAGAAKLESKIGKDERAAVMRDKTEKVGGEKAKGKGIDRRVLPGEVPESAKVSKKDAEGDSRLGTEGGGGAPKSSHRVSKKDGAKDGELKGDKTDREVALIDCRDRLGKEGENAKDLGRSSIGKERPVPAVPAADLPREGGLDLPGGEGKDVWKASEEPGRDYNFKSASLKDTKEALKEPPKRKSAVGSKDTLKAQKDDALQNDIQKQQFKKEASKQFVEAVAFEREGSKDVPPAEGKKKGKEGNRDSQAQKELKGRAGEAVKQPRRDTKKEDKELMLRDADDGEELKDAGKHGGMGAASKERQKDVKRDGTDQGPKDVKVGRKPGRKPGREPKSLQKSKTRDMELARRDIPVGNSTGGPRPPPPQTTVVPLLAPGVPTAEAPAPAPAAGAILPAGQLVLDSWVQCDNCNKWRLAMPGIDVNALLDKKWVCKMMKWLPGFNSCTFEEDATTAAVYERLGLQNPALAQPLLDPGLQLQHPVVPALAQADVLQDSKVLESKPGRVQKSNSKKKLNTSNLNQNGKINDMSSVKSKSLNDVVQQPLDRSSDKIGQEVLGIEDMFHTRGGADRRKLKEKDKPKRMRGSLGNGIREEERNRAALSMHQDHDGDLHEKTPATFLAGTEPDTGVEGSTWNGYLDPEFNKRQRGAFSQGGVRADSMGGKRKKKTDSSQENDDLQAKKKFKGDESRDWRGKYEAKALHEAHDDDGDMQSKSRQDFSNEDGESPDRGVISSKQQHATEGGPAGQQPPRKGKVMSGTKRDRRYNSRRDDSPPVDAQAAASRVMKNNNSWDVNYERDSIEKQESSSSDEHKYQKENSGRRLKDSGMNRRVESKERGSQQDAAKRTKRSNTDTGIDQVEKKREMVLKAEFNMSLAGLKEGTTDQKNGQPKKFSVSSEVMEFRLNKSQGPMEGQQQAAAAVGGGFNDEKSGDKRGKSSTRLFDEVSEVARTYAQHSSRQGAGDNESPNEVSPLPDLGRGYNNEEEVGQQNLMQKVAESRPRSQTSMASKVSFSGEGGSSEFESKRGSPIESTVSSSPLRSSKAGDQAAASGPPRVTEGVQDDHNTMIDTSNGRARGDDHYAMSNSREGANCRKFERGRSGGDEYTFFDESRERERERAGSASYVPADRYDRHPRDDRYRERGDSVDRYRDRGDNNNRDNNNRDGRYERRTGGRDDRSRERERDRDMLRDRDRSSRDNWPSADRGGGAGGDSARDERHSSREKVARQDWGGRPSSRESRLDKQGSLNWQDDPGVVKEGSHEGRDRGIEDEKPELRGHPDEGEVGPAPDIQKDGSKVRYEKLDLGGSKDIKPTPGRLPPSGQGLQGWEGDNRLGVSSVRKEPDVCATRNGFETTQTFVNNRNRGEALQSGPGSTGVRGRGSNHVDGGPLDSGKLDKDSKKVTEEDAPTRGGVARPPVSNSQAAKELMREATDLKHRADIKVKGNEGEFTDFYLWAACKYLKAAHLLELPTSEGVRQGDLKQALDLYNDTANLCIFCAGTYERRRDLPAAALARICAAVARFRAVMGKSGSFKSDCQELQTAANSATASGTHVAAVLTPPQAIFTRTSEKSTSHGAGVPSAVGESSSSSSASDLDNLNNHGNPSDKGFTATAVKGNQQSAVPGSTGGAGDVIPQRLHENFKRTLCTGLDFVGMMESWTRAQSATIAAEAACAGDPRQQDGMAHVRRVGELGFFGNMEVVLMGVLTALEALGQRGGS